MKQVVYELLVHLSPGCWLADAAAPAVALVLVVLLTWSAVKEEDPS
jgi:hypothetical protein